jgi:predicted RNase H-like nuclease (RuvC/YqgF family)
LMVNKYLNKEFKEELLYPKSEVTNVLNEQLPRELAEIITNNLGEDAELRNTEPIKTNISNIEWSESSVITQPWELNGEFEWKEEGLNVEIFEASTVNQEPHNSEMTNLKNQIKELKDAVERQDTYIYNLSNKYLEACKGYNESLKVIKEKENYIKKLIKSYNYFTEEQEVKINDLNLERENLKSELENEKLVNDFINQYMYPIAETTSMEDLES